MPSKIPQNTVSKWRKLVERIESLTSKDKLEWKETASEDEFLTAYKNAVITIKSSRYFRDGDTVPVMIIELSDASGKKIDSFDDEDLVDGGEFSSAYNRLLELRDTIARKVSGADQTLDQILKEMDADDEEIPF